VIGTSAATCYAFAVGTDASALTPLSSHAAAHDNGSILSRSSSNGKAGVCVPQWCFKMTLKESLHPPRLWVVNAPNTPPSISQVSFLFPSFLCFVFAQLVSHNPLTFAGWRVLGRDSSSLFFFSLH
jgi:hypothetical protein